MSRFADDHDEVVELPVREHDPTEQAMATAVRHALAEEDWSTQRLHALTDRADHRAARRRRQRLVKVSVATAAGSAVAAVLLAAAPALVAGLIPSAGRALPAGPPREYRTATLVHLSPADVHAVLPGAQPGLLHEQVTPDL